MKKYKKQKKQIKKFKISKLEMLKLKILKTDYFKNIIDHGIEFFRGERLCFSFLNTDYLLFIMNEQNDLKYSWLRVKRTSDKKIKYEKFSIDEVLNDETLDDSCKKVLLYNLDIFR